jgi:hypothetical protein
MKKKGLYISIISVVFFITLISFTSGNKRPKIFKLDLRREALSLYRQTNETYIKMEPIHGNKFMSGLNKVSSSDSMLPYPKSEYIKDIKFDWSSHRREAFGSDNWQCTWADDDNLYCAFGDGGGFGSSNDLGRVSLGYSRIEGNYDNYTAKNVWGGYEAENKAQFKGKSWGTVCIDGILYSWVVPDYSAWGWYPGHASECRLFYSNNHGAKWWPAKWLFFREDNLMIPTILQYGKDYADASDNYVYHYFMEPIEANDFKCSIPGKIYLARVPKDRMLDKQAYQFLSNIQGGKAQWNSNVQEKVPVFTDNVFGVGWNCSVSYNQGIKRYILMTEHLITSRGNLGVFEAENPWGPGRQSNI